MRLDADSMQWRPALTRATTRAKLLWAGFAIGAALASAVAVAGPRQDQNGPQQPGSASSPGMRPQPAIPNPDLQHGRPVARPQPPPPPGQVKLNPSKGPPVQSGKAPPEYRFESSDRALLLRYYRRRLRYINPAGRPHLFAGGSIPRSDLRYLTPLAPSLRRRLPPPPGGRRLSYFDGYVLAYDPETCSILAVIDLLP